MGPKEASPAGQMGLYQQDKQVIEIRLDARDSESQNGIDISRDIEHNSVSFVARQSVFDRKTQRNRAREVLRYV